MPSPLTVVPIEIVEEIIDNVAVIDSQDRYPNFRNTKACALTCHAFLQPARKCIFRSITIYEYNKDSPPREPYLELRDAHRRSFTRLLICNPDIGNYVRELQYVLFAPGFELEDPSPSVLQQLDRLEGLVIHAETFHCVWDRLHPSSRSTLLSLMHKPTIVSISISHIQNFTFSNLTQCTQLRKLRLRNITFSERDDALQVSHHIDPIQLQELDVDVNTYPNLTQNMKRNQKLPFDPEKIKSLKLLLWRPTAQFLERLSSLTHLHIVAFSLWPLALQPELLPVGCYIQLATPLLSTLQTLNIDIFLPSFAGPMYKIPDGLDKLTKAGMNRIERLQIRLQLPNVLPEAGEEIPDSTKDGWALFEDVILGPEWPCLQHFQLTVYAHREHGEMRFQVARTKLPRLSDVSFNRLSKFKYSEVIGQLSRA